MSSLTAKELNQLHEETGLSKLSIQDWHKRFIHECPTGNITKERYINLYRSYYPRARNSDNYAQMFFTVFDDDRDQALNFREFLRIVSVTQGTDEKAKVEIAYQAYNRNQLETNLSRKHFQHAVISILDLVETKDDNDEHKKREITIQWAMKCLGLDEKTEITKREFIRRCKDDTNLYEFLAFYCVPKPNCSDGDLHGKEKYKISIKTGTEGKTILSIKSTNINGNVYLILHGENVNSEPIQLQHSHTHKHPFEHGHTDIFTEFLPALGEIKGATLWHTGDKQHAWYVEDLSVTNELFNTTTYFPIQRWLDADEYDKMTKIELIPNQPPGYAQ
jgi:Ca2+-binding EF-hand superfamily protein